MSKGEKLKNIYDLTFKPRYEKYMATREGVQELASVLNCNRGLIEILDEHELRNVTLMLLDKNNIDVKYLNDFNSKLKDIQKVIDEYNQIHL